MKIRITSSVISIFTLWLLSIACGTAQEQNDRKNNQNAAMAGDVTPSDEEKDMSAEDKNLDQLVDQLIKEFNDLKNSKVTEEDGSEVAHSVEEPEEIEEDGNDPSEAEVEEPLSEEVSEQQAGEIDSSNENGEKVATLKCQELEALAKTNWDVVGNRELLESIKEVCPDIDLLLPPKIEDIDPLKWVRPPRREAGGR